jgi:hypothetical protein
MLLYSSWLEITSLLSDLDINLEILQDYIFFIIAVLYMWTLF